MTIEERYKLARRWAYAEHPYGDKTDLINGHIAGYKECEESITIVDSDGNKVTPETLKNACEIVRNTTKQKMINKACEWLKDHAQFTKRGEIWGFDVESFRKAMEE